MKHFSNFFHILKILGLRGLFYFVKLRFFKQAKVFVPLLNRNIYLRSGTSDEWLFYQIFSKRQYDVKFDNVETIVDLGANVGLVSLYLKKMYPEAQVICVEPESCNFQLLEKNTKGLSKLKPYQAGISSTPGFGRISNNLSNEPWAFRIKEHSSFVQGDVLMITLDQIINENDLEKIDLLKIDIEGSELDLFSKNYQSWLEITKNILIEVHEHISPGCGRSVLSAIHEVFGDYGLYVNGSNILIRRRDT